ncbi:MAG: Alginate biosynthesis protein AlgA [Saprospiraceae bacterium]|nr:Alginate biosynthesis protein AlgA [Saprospiraceae bacterium]
MPNNNHTYVAIMAGGVGSRFWPGSREARPKQFLDMLGVGKSLLRLTFERFLPLCPASHIFIVTNAAYKELIKQQIPELTDNHILCEPSRNNTGPCVAYTAFKLAALDPEANFVIAPSDHIVLKEQAFLDKIRLALGFAAHKEALVTLGIQPSRPDTGYGYIQMAEEAADGIFKVKRFAEKPDQETAKAFVSSGEYLWNAGIFVWNVRSILSAFERLSPDIFNILQQGNGLWNTAGEQHFIDKMYPTTPNISVDFAIMEKAPNVFTVPAEFGWSDLGTWASLHAECPKDAHGNVLQGDHILALDIADCLVRTPKGKLVVLKDLRDYIVVDEGDALLVYPKSKEQEIKQVTVMVKERFGETYL